VTSSSACPASSSTSESLNSATPAPCLWVVSISSSLIPVFSQEIASLLPGPSLFPRARRTQRFFSLPIGFSAPTVHSSLFSFSLLRGIGTSPLALPTTRDFNSRYPRRRDAETHDLAISRLRFSRVQSNSTSTSEARVADTRVSLPRPLASSRLMRPIAWPFNSRDPTSRDYVPPVPPKVDAPTKLEIATAISTCMQLSHSPTPICRYAMASGFYLRLKVNSFPGVQVVDSLPFEESFAPKLLPFGLHLVCSTILSKELSLLSFHQLSTQNHSEFNSSIKSHTRHMKEVSNRKQICKGTMPTTHRK
jgi:hypothetical protein